MIRDIAETGGGEVRADAMVVGSGLAGVDLARVLARGGLRVVVAESGGRDYDAKLHALNEVAFAAKPHREQTPDSEYHGYLAEHLRGISRLRQFGGTSNVWTGKWRVFTERDLAARPWLPGDGWPIGMEDLLPHYRACFADYGLGDVVEEAASPEAATVDAELAAAGLRTAAFYWEKTPTRSAVRFGTELERSERIEVIPRATATELVLDDGLLRVGTVRCRSLDGHEVAVSAAFVILAAGGSRRPACSSPRAGRSPRASATRATWSGGTTSTTRSTRRDASAPGRAPPHSRAGCSSNRGRVSACASRSTTRRGAASPS